MSIAIDSARFSFHARTKTSDNSTINLAALSLVVCLIIYLSTIKSSMVNEDATHAAPIVSDQSISKQLATPAPDISKLLIERTTLYNLSHYVEIQKNAPTPKVVIDSALLFSEGASALNRSASTAFQDLFADWNSDQNVEVFVLMRKNVQNEYVHNQMHRSLEKERANAINAYLSELNVNARVSFEGISAQQAGAR
ncbi:hypothetical protein A3715_12190 [Oleiphilus sp. HI0009]|uniref:hypothetical protein n=2 Tax=Oleiphilus sp. HI0125 TaxID=1822266 RepID=UPI0007C23AC1|nr:hypothetical protein [Oleiphilus sp. HI0125]KZX76791.1 hypothetical protein A3715_12190 [Oleiphilus sp. HI0009]KZZ58499.1 hypothetical protein A3762_07810 [Oleiphilus sp. HI0125]